MYKLKSTGAGMIKQFHCDFLSDIGKLPTSKRIGAKQDGDTVSDNPCAPSSRCFCYEDASEWILGMETDTWIRMGSKYGNASGGGGSGITSYNQLSDIPMENLTGQISSPVVLSNLPPEVYKVKGVYCITSGSRALSTEGSIFAVSKNGRIIHISQDGISRLDVNPDGTYAEDNYQTSDDVVNEILNQLKSDDFNDFITDKINENMSEPAEISDITDNDIESLFT